MEVFECVSRHPSHILLKPETPRSTTNYSSFYSQKIRHVQRSRGDQSSVSLFCRQLKRDTNGVVDEFKFTETRLCSAQYFICTKQVQFASLRYLVSTIGTRLVVSASTDIDVIEVRFQSNTRGLSLCSPLQSMAQCWKHRSFSSPAPCRNSSASSPSRPESY